MTGQRKVNGPLAEYLTSVRGDCITAQVTADGAVDGVTPKVVDSLAFAANELKAKSLYHVLVAGTADFPSDAAPSPFTVRVRWAGGTIVDSTFTPPVSTAATGKEYVAEFWITVRDLGATGHIIGFSRNLNRIGVSGTTNTDIKIPAQATVDTTTAQSLDVVIIAGKAVAGWVIRASSGLMLPEKIGTL